MELSNNSGFSCCLGSAGLCLYFAPHIHSFIPIWFTGVCVISCARAFHSRLPLIRVYPTVHHATSAGISACCRSAATRLILICLPDDQLYPGSLPDIRYKVLHLYRHFSFQHFSRFHAVPQLPLPCIMVCNTPLPNPCGSRADFVVLHFRRTHFGAGPLDQWGAITRASLDNW